MVLVTERGRIEVWSWPVCTLTMHSGQVAKTKLTQDSRYPAWNSNTVRPQILVHNFTPISNYSVHNTNVT